jgi:hypothetical protein
MPFTLIPSEKKLCRPLAIFHGVLIAPPKKKSKYRSWYLTPCCGLEVQDPTQALKSVKGPGNTFDLNPKWERTLPSFGNFLWDTYSPPPKKQSRGGAINTPWKIAKGRQSFFSLGIKVKGIARAFNWRKCMGGILHLKPTAGCQISTLIFEFFLGDPINIPL